jgi:hypothetical protein
MSLSRIRARSCGWALRQARTTLALSSATRVSTTSSIGNDPRAGCRRRSRAGASLGTRSIVVPESGPLPTCDRTAPCASRTRSASRTAGRLTPSRSAKSRSGDSRSPAHSAPVTLRVSYAFQHQFVGPNATQAPIHRSACRGWTQGRPRLADSWSDRPCDPQVHQKMYLLRTRQLKALQNDQSIALIRP